MMVARRVASVAVAVSLLVAMGCVSTARYDQLVEEKKGVELELGEASGLVGQLEGDLEKVKASLKKAQVALAAKVKDLSTSKQRLLSAESKLKQLQARLSASGKALSKAKAETEAARKEATNLKAKLSSAEAKVKGLTIQLEALKAPKAPAGQ